MNTSSENKIIKLLSSPVMLAVTAALIAYLNYFIFLVVPNERIMGPVQRIFYFHVGAATASYVSIGAMFIASLLVFSSRSKKADAVAQAAGEVSLLLCSMVLISGMIWGRAAWNTWFRWEPRLVSFLLTWLLMLSYNLLRAFSEKDKVAIQAATLAVLGAVSVPVMIFSIKLLPQFEQLHPQVVENRGLKDPTFQQAMFLGMGTLTVLTGYLIALRTRIGLLERN